VPDEPRRPRLDRGVAVVVALTLALAGCSTPADPWEEMRSAVRQVAITLAGTAMTVETLHRLPPTASAADLALADDAVVVEAAEERILLLDIALPDEGTRRDALRLVRDAAAELADTQAQVAAAEPGRPVPTEDLRRLADRLLELADEMADERS